MTPTVEFDEDDDVVISHPMCPCCFGRGTWTDHDISGWSGESRCDCCNGTGQLIAGHHRRSEHE